ncbi:MAG: hypothetical protein H6R37_916, partial [Deltaproteobacteria bacterium]|nr:hypothetical protein [Deltaproteobacteria bacterium]
WTRTVIYDIPAGKWMRLDVKDPMIVSRMRKMGLIQEYDPPDKLLQDWTKEYKLAEEIAKKEGLVK